MEEEEDIIVNDLFYSSSASAFRTPAAANYRVGDFYIVEPNFSDEDDEEPAPFWIVRIGADGFSKSAEGDKHVTMQYLHLEDHQDEKKRDKRAEFLSTHLNGVDADLHKFYAAEYYWKQNAEMIQCRTSALLCKITMQSVKYVNEATGEARARPCRFGKTSIHANYIQRIIHAVKIAGEAKLQCGNVFSKQYQIFLLNIIIFSGSPESDDEDKPLVSSSSSSSSSSSPSSSSSSSPSSSSAAKNELDDDDAIPLSQWKKQKTR